MSKMIQKAIECRTICLLSTVSMNAQFGIFQSIRRFDLIILMIQQSNSYRMFHFQTTILSQPFWHFWRSDEKFWNSWFQHWIHSNHCFWRRFEILFEFQSKDESLPIVAKIHAGFRSPTTRASSEKYIQCEKYCAISLLRKIYTFFAIRSRYVQRICGSLVWWFIECTLWHQFIDIHSENGEILRTDQQFWKHYSTA